MLKKESLKEIARKFDPVIRFFNFPLAYLSGRSENLEKAFFRPVVRSYSNNSKDHYIQYVTLPRNVDQIPTEWTSTDRFKEYAIILQGPIRTEDNFTVETVRLYKKCYPGAGIIVSTWLGSDEFAKNEVTKLGAVWVESQAPENPGIGNRNMQLTSSLAGVKKAEELGYRFAVKSRTDQRVYANDALEYFANLQEAYPSADPEVVSKRLIYTSWGASYRTYPFRVSDFIVFGETGELIKLYGIERDKRTKKCNTGDPDYRRHFSNDFYNDLEKKRGASPYEHFPDYENIFFKYVETEAYIAYHYYVENIAPIEHGDDLLDIYYSYLKKYAVIADSEKLVMYWPTHSFYASSVKWFTELDFPGRMDFKKWLDIYLHYEPKQDRTKAAGSENGKAGTA